MAWNLTPEEEEQILKDQGGYVVRRGGRVPVPSSVIQAQRQKRRQAIAAATGKILWAHIKRHEDELVGAYKAIAWAGNQITKLRPDARKRVPHVEFYPAALPGLLDDYLSKLPIEDIVEIPKYLIYGARVFYEITGDPGSRIHWIWRQIQGLKWQARDPNSGKGRIAREIAKIVKEPLSLGRVPLKDIPVFSPFARMVPYEAAYRFDLAWEVFQRLQRSVRVPKSKPPLPQPVAMLLPSNEPAAPWPWPPAGGAPVSWILEYGPGILSPEDWFNSVSYTHLTLPTKA